VSFSRELFRGGGERVARSHVPAGGGSGMIDVLHRHCREAGVEFALGHRVERLSVDPGGRVTGVATQDRVWESSAVVLATGGCGADPDMLARWWPDALEGAGDWAWYIGAPSARGDALRIAEQVDAQVVGLNRGLALLRPNFGPTIDLTFPGWLIMVNGEGRRFFDETTPYALSQPLIRSQPGPIHAVWDEAAKRESGTTDSTLTGPPSDLLRSNWAETTLDAMIEAQAVLRADTIEALAGAIGTNPANLATTIAVYNQDVSHCHDTHFLKDPKLMAPIATPPYYATELRQSLITMTFVGPRINAHAEVLSTTGAAIPGLYAAGECTGGVIGDVNVGSGNSLTSCAVFGRIAGRGAVSNSSERPTA
jgi:fumarate reductase flavoprotein subunit